MPRLRLIGLILFVTTIFVGMIAVATQTKEIRFTLPEGQRPIIGQPERDPREPRHGGELEGESPDGVEFFRIPIAWPLTFSGGAGLLLWFGTAPRPTSPAARRRRRRRRK